MNKDLELLTRVIDEKSAKILDANDKIWEYAELAFHETRSAALLKSILKEEGFTLTEGDAGVLYTAPHYRDSLLKFLEKYNGKYDMIVLAKVRGELPSRSTQGCGDGSSKLLGDC